MPRDRILNPRRRTLLRSYIPASENWASLIILLLLTLILVWVAAQKDHFNPTSRSLSPELLLESSDSTELYTPPLKSWSENSADTHAAAPDLGIYPDAILDSVWQAKNPVKTFNAESLYEKINGEAPKFLRQGFRSMHYLVLQSKTSKQEIAIELYEQNDQGGSMGIFAEHQSAGTEIEQQGQVYYFSTSIGVIGRKGRFFFRVAGDAATPEIQQKSQQLVSAFEALPGEEKSNQSENEELLILTEGMGIAPERVFLQRENVFQFDFVHDVWFGKFEQDGQEQIFLHHAASPEDAQTLFEDIVAEQSYDYEIKDQTDNSALLWHEFLENYFAIGVAGPYVYGVENGPDAASAEAVLQKLSGALADGE